MIITKHVLKRCLKEADSLVEMDLTERQRQNRIKCIWLRYELEQISYEDALEQTAAELIALAQIVSE